VLAGIGLVIIAGQLYAAAGLKAPAAGLDKITGLPEAAVKAVSDTQGLSKQLRDAGAVLLTDTCSSISQAIPPGTKVAALDSAKQTHYLPAFMNIQAWFGSTQDCINAAVTGRWNGVAP
jgi:hypothetical protein